MEPSLQHKTHIITIVRKSLQFTYACVRACVHYVLTERKLQKIITVGS